MPQDLETFVKEYTKAVIAAGDVSRQDIEDSYMAALFREAVDARLQGLTDFIRNKLEEKVPCTWFTGEPLQNILRARELIQKFSRLADDLIQANVKIIADHTAEDLGFSESQYKRILRDTFFEVFVEMGRCGFEIFDLEVKDIDHVEMKMSKKKNGIFVLQPTLFFFGGRTQVDIGILELPYDGGIVPDYEDPEGGQRSDSPAQ